MPSSASHRGRAYLWNRRALYIGPGVAASIHAHYATQICIVTRLRVCWREGWSAPRAAALVDDVVRTLASPVVDRHPDARVAAALELLAAAPDRKLPLGDVATGVALSPSRIAHLLHDEIRMPARRYLLWLRLRDAIQVLARGDSITTAAHAAGFADAPHLDRTFRRMFGFTPSAALSVSTFVQDVAADPR